LRTSEAILHIVGNETRRRILALLSEEPHYVTQMAKKLDVTQPAVLRHLQILEGSGLIESFSVVNPLGAARKYYKICESLQLEIALNPQAFRVTERPEPTVCVRYLEKAGAFERLTGEINAADDIDSKASRANEMMMAADALLSCAGYDGKNPVCVKCRTEATLRRKASQIILHVSKGDLRSGLQALTETIDQLFRLPSGNF